MTTMANGASTQASGGKMKFKPTRSTAATRPPIPAGKWIDSTIVKGKGKVVVAQTNDGSLGAPGISISVKLGRADDDKNEKYSGTEETMRFYFHDDEDGAKTRAANFTKVRLRELCEAIGIDFDENYPTSIDDEADLKPLIKALEGQRIPELWTVLRSYQAKSGEMVESAEMRFKEPGEQANKSGEEEEEPEEAPKRGAKGKGRR